MLQQELLINQAKVEWNPSFNDDIESYEDFIIDKWKLYFS